MKTHFSPARCLGVFLTIAGMLHAGPVKPSDYKAPVRLACVGDSITYGAGAAKGMSYPSQLQEMLGDAWLVKNFGVSGRTLMRSGDRPYWNEKAFQQAQEFDPDVVVIMLGTNDTKPPNWAHKEDFEKDYRELVKTFQDLKSKPRVFVCRATPVPEPGNYGINEAAIQEQIPIVDRLAQELKTGSIDMHAALAGKSELLPDRIHPNSEGAGEMAKAAYQVLTGMDPSKVLRPNGLFRSSGAVLQRDAAVPVWGTAGDGMKISVRFAGQDVTTTARGGKWMVTLKPMKGSGEPQVMKISGSTTITLDNIVVGDVWLASGQSNMERQLGPRPRQQELTGWREAAAAADFPLIREYKLPLKFSATPLEDTSANWTVCTPKSAPDFSAVGFYFARELQPKIGVPVGIIHSSWGGTVVEAWTSPEVLEKEGVTVGEALNQNSPAVLYQAMVAPLLPFSIKGVIWYQGEANNGNAREYRDRFPAMIADWRQRWQSPELPFLFVQIAPHKDMKPELREAQFLTLAKTKNTAMAVITDNGDANDIHPVNKEPVGVRLSLAARALAYGERIEWSGPLYKEMKIAGGRCELTFTHTGKGLEARGGELKGFTIAGADGNFIPATAEIQGSSVIVSNKEVPEPKAVRYGWENVPDVNLFNQDGLPASPFRTDVD